MNNKRHSSKLSGATSPLNLARLIIGLFTRAFCNDDGSIMLILRSLCIVGKSGGSSQNGQSKNFIVAVGTAS